MGIEPFSATMIEVAKQGIKEIGKEVSKGIKEGVKEGVKESADKLSEGIKEKYLTKETLPVNEVSENIPKELKEISKEVAEVEQTIDHNPESIAENVETVKVDLKSIEGKLNDFVNGFKENLANKVSIADHADHVINKGLDIGKDINTYVKDINERLKQAGIDVKDISEKINIPTNYGGLDDSELYESDFGDGE